MKKEIAKNILAKYEEKLTKVKSVTITIEQKENNENDYYICCNMLRVYHLKEGNEITARQIECLKNNTTMKISRHKLSDRTSKMAASVIISIIKENKIDIEDIVVF